MGNFNVVSYSYVEYQWVMKLAKSKLFKSSSCIHYIKCTLWCKVNLILCTRRYRTTDNYISCMCSYSLTEISGQNHHF